MRVVASLAAAVLAGLSAVPAAWGQQYFTWQGDNNNNWKNSGNWAQTPGSGDVPSAPSHYVTFDDTADLFEVDLEDDSYTVGSVTFDLSAGGSFLLRSSTTLDGYLRVAGDLTNTNPAYVRLDDTIAYGQRQSGEWNLNPDPQYMVFDCAIVGTDSAVEDKEIDLHGGVTLNGEDAGWAFIGLFNVEPGSTVRVGAPQVLRNAHVTVNQGGVFDVVTNDISARIGSLRGDGDIELPPNARLTVGRDVIKGQNDYYGVLISDASNTLIKEGDKTWLLGGSNMFGGTTEIDEGAIQPLVVDALVQSTVSVNVDEGLDPNGLDVILGALNGSGDLDLGSAILTVGANNASTTYSGVISGSGSLIKTGSGEMRLSGANTYTGNTTIEGGSLYITADNNLGNGGMLTLDGGTLITQNVFALNRDIHQNNLQSNTSRIEVEGSSSQARLNGDLSGFSFETLEKTGDGSFRFNQPTSYNGVVRVSAGSVTLRAPDALQHARVQVNVDGGLDLDAAGADVQLAGLAGGGDIDNEGHNLIIDSDIDGTYMGVLSGSGGLTKSGPADLTLSGANTFTGDTHVLSTGFGGGIMVGHVDALQDSTVYVDNDGALDVNGLDANLGGLAGSGSLNIGSQTVSVGANDADTSYSGDLTGEGTLIKQYASALTLEGGVSNLGALSHYGSGDLNIRGGTLDLTGEAANVLYLRSATTTRVEGGAVVTLTGSGGSNRTVLTNSAKLWVQDAGSSLITPRLDIGPEGVGTAYVNVLGGAMIDAERIQVGDLALDNGAAGTLSVYTDGAVHADEIVLYRRGTIYAHGNGLLETDRLVDGDAEPHAILISDFTAGPALTIGVNDGSSVVDALIEDSIAGPGSLRKVGAGTLELRSANSFSNGVVLDGGMLSLSDPNAAGTGTIVAAAGTTITQSSGVDLANPIELHGDIALRVNGGETTQIGDITDVGGNFGVTKQGVGALWFESPKSFSGTLTVEQGILGLATDDAYTGPTVVNGGKVFFDNPLALRNSAVQLNAANGILFLQPSSQDYYEMGSLAGTGTLAISNAGAGLKVGGNNTSTTYAGALIGDNQLIKTGDGAFELTADSSFTGGVTVAAGILLAANTTGSATGTGGVTINDGGTLGGSGAVTGAVVVHTGGTIAPGASTGVLNVEDVTFNADSTLAIEFAAADDYDQLDAAGTVTLDGTLDVIYLGDFVAAPDDSFVILSATTLSGAFQNVNYPDAQNWNIVYDYAAGTVSVVLACMDSDQDGVCDAEDTCPGFDDNLDTDGDGFADGCDVCEGFDDTIDSDGDTTPDGCDSCPNAPDVHNVTQNANFPTIQTALDAAAQNDVIELGPCTIRENGIMLDGKSITLRGQGPDVTVIDGDAAGRVFQLANGAMAVFEDLTVRNGFASDEQGAAAVLLTQSAVIARNCRFEHNLTTALMLAPSGAITLNESEAQFDRCVFRNNAAQSNAFASAVAAFSSTPSFTNCLFAEDADSPTVLAFVDSIGLGPARLVNCTFADFDGFAYVASSMEATSVIVENSVFDDGALAVAAVGGVITTSRCLYPGATGNNVDGVPTFTDPGNGNYSLAPSSLGIDAADYDAYVAAGGGATDLNGDPRTHDDAGTDDTGAGALTYLDMGAYEFQGTTECGIGGDFDNDGDVDVADYARLAICLTGPGGGLGADCDCFDLDSDGDVDTRDFAEFQANFTGQ